MSAGGLGGRSPVSVIRQVAILMALSCGLVTALLLLMRPPDARRQHTPEHATTALLALVQAIRPVVGTPAALPDAQALRRLWPACAARPPADHQGLRSFHPQQSQRDLRPADLRRREILQWIVRRLPVPALAGGDPRVRRHDSAEFEEIGFFDIFRDSQRGEAGTHSAVRHETTCDTGLSGFGEQRDPVQGGACVIIHAKRCGDP